MTDPVVDNIVKKLYGDDEVSIELHEHVLGEWNISSKTCTCGKTCIDFTQLYMHQAGALREQLRQLGG